MTCKRGVTCHDMHTKERAHRPATLHARRQHVTDWFINPFSYRQQQVRTTRLDTHARCLSACLTLSFSSLLVLHRLLQAMATPVERKGGKALDSRQAKARRAVGVRTDGTARIIVVSPWLQSSKSGWLYFRRFPARPCVAGLEA